MICLEHMENRAIRLWGSNHSIINSTTGCEPVNSRVIRDDCFFIVSIGKMILIIAYII